MSLRIIFMGTPDYSVPTLTALADSGHDILAVYSQPPRRSGRGMNEQKSPVHAKADSLGFPVLTPVNFKQSADINSFENFNADIAVVVAYGLILPQIVLDAPRLGCINGHASLLPRWRGAAPIQRAIEAGDKKTGVMIMQMEAGLDTGPVLASNHLAISRDMNAGELHDKLAQMTADLMVEALNGLENGEITPTPQPDDGVTYARKIGKKEARISWDKPVSQVYNHLRAMNPFPGSWCEMKLGNKMTRVKIIAATPVEATGTPGEVLDDQLTIACKSGALRLLRLQKAGKQPMDAQEFLRGNQIAIGTVLT